MKEQIKDDTPIEELQKTLKEIIERLKKLEDKQLNPFQLQDFEDIKPMGTPDPCLGCSNHPSNGGSGICLCTLGNKITYTSGSAL